MSSLEDPYEILGVSTDADERTVRKAYLRAIKKTKPEADPAGFAKIRAAYDALQAGTQEVAVVFSASPTHGNEPIEAEGHEYEQRGEPLEKEEEGECIDYDDAEGSFEALDDAIDAIRNHDLPRAQANLQRCWTLSEGGAASSFDGDRYGPFILTMLKELWEVRELLRPKEFCELGVALVDQDADLALNTFARIQQRDAIRWIKFKQHLEGPGARLRDGLGISFENHTSRGEWITATLFLAFSMFLLYSALS